MSSLSPGAEFLGFSYHLPHDQWQPTHYNIFKNNDHIFTVLKVQTEAKLLVNNALKYH